MTSQAFIELTPLGAKGAIVYPKGENFVFKQLHWHEFGGGWDGVAEPTRLAAWVKTWMPRDIKTTLIVPRQMVLSRILTLPSFDPQELKRMVALQLGEHFPYAVDEVAWDLSIMGVMGNGFTQVIVWVVPEKDLMRWIEPMLGVGIKFKAVTLNITGLASQIKRNQLSKLLTSWQLLLVVDIANTECVFIRNNQQVFLRSLDVGFGHVQQPSEVFTTELVLTIKDFLKTYPQDEFNHISVIATSSMPAWFEDWCKRQSFQYRSIESNQILKDKKCIIPPVFREKGISLTSINGLTAIDAASALELMPPALKKRDNVVLQKRYVIQTAILLALAAFFILFAWQMPLIQARLQLGRLMAVSTQQQKQVNDIDQLRQSLDSLKKLYAGTVSFNRVAEAIEQGLGGKVYLNTLSMNAERVLSVEGYGREGVDLDGVQSRLMNTGIVKDVNLDYVNKRVTQEGQWVYFRMTMTIKAKEE